MRGRDFTSRTFLWLTLVFAAAILFSCDAWNGGEVGLSPPPAAPWSGVKQFGTAAPDYAMAVATDSSGNVYVACFDNGNLVTRKFALSGNLVWKSTPLRVSDIQALSYGSVTGIAVGSGGVYAVGTTTVSLDGSAMGGTWDGFLTKYDPAIGTSPGVLQIRGSTQRTDIQGVALDPSGNIYIGGSFLLTDQTPFVSRYGWTSGPLPVQAWTNMSFGAASDRLVAGVAVGDAGTIHAAGISVNSPTDLDIFIVRLSAATGVQIGTTVRDGSLGMDGVNAVAADSSNNTYVAGLTDNVFSGSNAGGSDIIAAKYDAAGNNVWRFQYGTASDESANGIAVTGGSVYLTGGTYGNLGGALNKDATLQSSDVFLILLPNASSGSVTPTWTRMYGAVGSTTNLWGDYGYGVAASPDGSAAVVGYTSASFENVNAPLGTLDGFLIKVSPAGVLQ